MVSIPVVLEAIHRAFSPAIVEEIELKEFEGRIMGSVRVSDSPTFNQLDDIRRQQLLFRNLKELLGAEALKVGPVVLQPTRRG